MSEREYDAIGMNGTTGDSVGSEVNEDNPEIETNEDTIGVAAPRRERLDSIVESLLFASGTPLPLRRLIDILNGPPANDIKAAIERLMREYAGHDHGIHLVAVAGGYQFRSAPQNAEWVRALLRERPARLGRASMETLAIIAYKQPATRAEIEMVRGVDAESSLSSLLAKRLVRIAGRKEAVGRPLLYTTTPEFLELFGLKDLADLPALKEIGPAPEAEDETAIDDGEGSTAAAEDTPRSGDQLTAGSGGADPGGEGAAERSPSNGAGHEGGSDSGPHHD